MSEFLQLDSEQLRIGLEIAAGIVSLSVLGFTLGQRRYIRERDGNTCQLCGHPLHEGIACDTTHLEVDHIIPQRFARDDLGMSEEEINSPLNGLTICRNIHRGHPDSKHPDAHKAWWDYSNGVKDAFQKVFKKRDEEVEDGENYWNGEFDAPESEIAVQNTVVYQRNHPDRKFPQGAKKK